MLNKDRYDAVSSMVNELCPDLMAEVYTAHGDEENIHVSFDFVGSLIIRKDEPLSIISERLTQTLLDLVKLHIEQLRKLSENKK